MEPDAVIRFLASRYMHAVDIFSKSSVWSPKLTFSMNKNSQAEILGKLPKTAYCRQTLYQD